MSDLHLTLLCGPQVVSEGTTTFEDLPSMIETLTEGEVECDSGEADKALLKALDASYGTTYGETPLANDYVLVLRVRH